MAQKITIHDSARRPWGIETLVTVDDDGDIFNFAVCNKETVDTATLEREASERTDKQKQIIAAKELRAGTVETLQDDITTLEAEKQKLQDDIATLEEEKSDLEAN